MNELFIIGIIKDITPPVSMPEIAPCLLTVFEYKENKIKGPNDDPNPYHANSIKEKIVEYFCKATIYESIPIIKILDLETRISSFDEASLRKILL